MRLLITILLIGVACRAVSAGITATVSPIAGATNYVFVIEGTNAFCWSCSSDSNSCALSPFDANEDAVLGVLAIGTNWWTWTDFLHVPGPVLTNLYIVSDIPVANATLEDSQDLQGWFSEGPFNGTNVLVAPTAVSTFYRLNVPGPLAQRPRLTVTPLYQMAVPYSSGGWFGMPGK